MHPFLINDLSKSLQHSMRNLPQKLRKKPIQYFVDYCFPNKWKDGCGYVYNI